MNNFLNLISVSELIDKRKFYIAYYQRGYRWKEQQVRQLLDDLKNFQPTDAVPAYFLQVLILSPQTNGVSHVVDGQQRLTPIKLILEKLQLKETINFEYERKVNGKLDEYFMNEAQKVIDAWFEKHSYEEKEILIKRLLSAQFLVYDLTIEGKEDISDMENIVFGRINSGKISAKDSELVKCVMLTPQLDEPTEVTRRRADEWDEIERALNDEEFFAFLTPHNAQDTNDRMTRIFIAAGYTPDDSLRKDETFPYLAKIQNEIRESGLSRQTIWLKICAAFTSLQAWYRNNIAYHAVGWWIHRYQYGDGLTNINNLTDICKALEDRIKILKEPNIDTDDLYNDNKGKAWQILFLFNLAYASCCQHLRYDFRRHRMISTWSIEHLMARNVCNLNESEFENYHKYASIPEKYSWNSYSEKCKTNEGKQYLEEMLGTEEYPKDNDHSLGNLALLPKEANSSLNNNLFRMKRDNINKWYASLKDYFIPPATKDYFIPPATFAVFNKLFPEMNVLKPYLSTDDKKSYIDAIKVIIGKFVEEVKKHA